MRERIVYIVGGIIVVLLFVILIKILTNQNKIALVNTELQKQLTELETTANFLKSDIQLIREKKEVVKESITKKETKIQNNASKKIVIDNKPYTNDESMRIITNFFKQRNIPSSYSR